MTFRTVQMCVVGAVTLLFVASSFAQADFEELGLGIKARGAVLTPGAGRLYVSAYDLDQLVEIDLATWKVLRKLAVGNGPTELVLSDDGSLLACLNRLGNSVSLIDLDAFEVVGTVETGASPVALAAMSGGFATADSFGDSVTLIDGASRSIASTISGVESVPNGIAVSENFVGVTTRLPMALLLFQGDALDARTELSLDEAPLAVRAMPGDRFVVLTRGAVFVVDAGTGSVRTRREIIATDIYADSNRLLLLTPDALLQLDFDLEEHSRIPVATSSRVASSEGVIVVLSPLSGSLSLAGLDPRPAPPQLAQESAVETIADVTEPEPVAKKTVAKEPAPVPEEEAVAIPEPAAPATTNFSAQTPASIEAAAAAAEARKAERAEKRHARKEMKEARPPRATPREIDEERYSRRPSRANIAGNRPHAPILGVTAGPTFEDALSDGLGMGEEWGSIASIDWAQPLENLSWGGSWQHTGDTDTYDGGVEFYIDDAFVQAERMSRDGATGEIAIEGEVRVSRGASRMTANRLFYRVPPEALEEKPESPGAQLRLMRPLVPAGFVEEAQEDRLRFGIFEAEQIDLDEERRALKADFMRYDLAAETGEFIAPRGRTGPLYFSAATLNIAGPESVVGDDMWVSTCDRPVPHYRLRLSRGQVEEGSVASGSNARLQLGRATTPVYLPRFKTSGLDDDRRYGLDFDMGHESGIGYFMNVGNWYRATPNFDLAVRIYPTSEEGIGFGFDGEYDLMDSPRSPFFRSRGSFRTLYTTEERGYTEWYHRQEFTKKLTLLTQWEQWYDPAFVKDFYYDEYKDRTGPRSFVNLTHVGEGSIATVTAAKATHDFTFETEKLPEASYHLLDRQVLGNLYFAFDTFAGEYRRPREDIDASRLASVMRVSYDMNAAKGVNIVPFVELDSTWYSDVLPDGDSELRLVPTTGATIQTRFQRAFSGAGRFSGFKHIVLPSVTYLYRPESSLDGDEAPRFDDLDDRPGRSRVESKIDNLLLGRNAATDEIWPVARLTLYQGNDFSNEAGDSSDYEIDAEVRPRPWWGLRAVAEHHNVDEEPGIPAADFNRVLAFLFYDDSSGRNKKNGRIGFAYTRADDLTVNEEILYGAGYRLSDKWSVAAEHRYDFELSELTRQSYEIRRRLHRWEMGLRVRDRASGFDIGVQFSLIDFPGARLDL